MPYKVLYYKRGQVTLRRRYFKTRNQAWVFVRSAKKGRKISQVYGPVRTRSK